jgi:hypothetical protein
VLKHSADRARRENNAISDTETAIKLKDTNLLAASIVTKLTLRNENSQPPAGLRDAIQKVLLKKTHFITSDIEVSEVREQRLFDKLNEDLLSGDLTPPYKDKVEAIVDFC